MFKANISRTNLLILFTANAAGMILEVTAARILSPFFGSSNLVWTIIISMMLLFNGLGNHLGGKYADKVDSSLLLYLTSSLFLSSFASEEDIFQLNMAIIVIAIFMVPSVASGMISPIISKVELEKQDIVGKKAGVIYVIITLGSLFGTLIGGLFFVPVFGSNKTLYIITVLTGLLTLFCKVKDYKKKLLIPAVLMYGLWIVSILNVAFGDRLIGSQKNDMLIIDTTENYVKIYDTEYNGEPVKLMNISGGYSSANFLDPAKRDELVFAYTKAYNLVMEKKSDAASYLMIGGAGYSYPRYLLSHYPDKTMDVVEIDGKVTEIAKEHFYLQDFINEYGDDRLGLYTADGRLFMEQTDKRYDVVLNDSFLGDIPARSMSTLEAVRAIKSCLNEGGVYATNISVGQTGQDSAFLRSEIKTILQEFDYVWLYNAKLESYGGNYMIIASDTDYGYPTETITVAGEDIIYTDDMSPVEFNSFFD